MLLKKAIQLLNFSTTRFLLEFRSKSWCYTSATYKVTSHFCCRHIFEKQFRVGPCRIHAVQYKITLLFFPLSLHGFFYLQAGDKFHVGWGGPGIKCATVVACTTKDTSHHLDLSISSPSSGGSIQNITSHNDNCQSLHSDG